MNQIIIATHSKLAEGFYKAVMFFNSAAENVDFINCYEETNECERQIEEKLKQYEGRNIIVCTDLAGGSVNQFAAKLTREYKFHLVSGTNLAMLLEMVFAAEDLTAEEIKNIIATSKEQIVYVNNLSNDDLISSDDEEL